MRIWMLVCLIAVGGCKKETEVLVGFATDLKAKGQIDHVDFQVFNQQSQVIEVTQSWDLADVPAGLYELPGSFGVFSDGSEPTVKLDLIGSLKGQETVKRESVLSPVSGKIVFLRMTLVDECNEVSGTQCPTGEVCIEGLCRASAVNHVTLPTYVKGHELEIDCNSGTQFIVSSTGAPIKPKGTCPAGQFCLEGTCYLDPPGPAPTAIGPSSWTPTNAAPATPTTTLHGLYTTPDGDTFAVGEKGVILHLSGGVISDETFDPTHELWSVWGTGAGDVWAVGAGGVVLHRSAAGWAADSADPGTDRLSGIWGIGGELFAVGFANGAPNVFHRTGGAWINDDVSAGSAPLQAVWGSSATDVWAVGNNFQILHFDGTSWSPFGSAPNVSKSGKSIAPLVSGSGPDLLGVTGSGPGDVYFVGRGGTIAHLGSDGTIAMQTSGTKSDLFGAWASSASDIFVVGDNGVILNSTGDGSWKSQESGTRAALFSIGGDGSTNVFAAGRVGKLLHFGSGSCSADSDCVAGDYCNSNGQCAPQKAQGQSCNADNGGDCLTAGCSECVSGLFCTDHVCCDAPKDKCGGCMQCSAPTGTCVAVPAGSDPHNVCPANSDECQDLDCNGSGTCNKPDNLSCGSNVCMASMLTTHSCEAGACSANVATSCALGTACATDGMSCLGSCAADSDCAQSGVGAYCDENGNCQTRKAQAGSCNLTNDCKQKGTCGECQGGLTCVDGFCCNQACGGACQACDVTPGTCTAITTGQPHHGGACTGAGQICGGACQAGNTATCTYPALNSVGVAARCSDATTSVPAIVCNGAGAEQNPNPGSVACGAYNCDQTTDAGAGLCYSSCSATAPALLYCSGTNACVGTRCGIANGQPCTRANANACGSTFCANNYNANNGFVGTVCCATACNNPCAGNGNVMQAPSCDTTGTCNPIGANCGLYMCDANLVCETTCTQSSDCYRNGPGGNDSFCSATPPASGFCELH